MFTQVYSQYTYILIKLKHNINQTQYNINQTEVREGFTEEAIFKMFFKGKMKQEYDKGIPLNGTPYIKSQRYNTWDPFKLISIFS